MPVVDRLGMVIAQHLVAAVLKTLTKNRLHQTENWLAHQQITEDSVQFIGLPNNEMVFAQITVLNRFGVIEKLRRFYREVLSFHLLQVRPESTQTHPA